MPFPNYTLKTCFSLMLFLELQDKDSIQIKMEGNRPLGSKSLHLGAVHRLTRQPLLGYKAIIFSHSYSNCMFFQYKQIPDTSLVATKKFP